MCDNNLVNNKLLEKIVNKAHENEPVDQPRHCPFLKNAPLEGERLSPVQAKVDFTRPRMIDLEKTYGEPSTSLAKFGRTTVMTSVDMVKV